MKKLVYLFCFMLLGLQCQAIEIFPLSNNQPIPIDGERKNNENGDVIILNSQKGMDYDALKQTAILSATLTSATLATTRLAANRNSTLTPRTYIRPDGTVIEVSDPYIVQIEGMNYVMMKDNPSKKWSKNDILGINDTKTTIFQALKGLESDGDRTKLTPQELKRANIRFVKLDNNGALLVNDKTQDFNLDKISYIDMTNLRNIANGSVTGVFGHFNLYLKTNNNSKKMVIGYVTLHSDNDIKTLFK